MTPHNLSKAKFPVAGASCLFGLALVLLPGRLAAGQAMARVPSIDQALEMQTDSKTIAFTTKDPLSKAQKDRVERYGEYTVIDGDERMTHLWTVDVTAAPVAAPAKEAKEKSTASAAPTPPFGVPEAHRLTEGDG